MLLLVTGIDKSEGKTPQERASLRPKSCRKFDRPKPEKNLFVVLDRHQNHFRPLIIAWRGASVGPGRISTNGQPEVLKLI